MSKTSQYRSTSITKPLILSELTPTQPQPTVNAIDLGLNNYSDRAAYSVVYEHNETDLTALFRLNALNDENKTQSITYSIGGAPISPNF